MPAQVTAVQNPLVSQLAARINGPLSLDEPYIIQDRVPQTQSRHVVVIWDAWDDMARDKRGRIITDAFQQAGIHDVVRVATGLTQQEALTLGYLRYQIDALWRQSDGDAVRKKLKKAIESTKGIHVRIGASVQLRFPTLEHAEEAYRNLSAAVPGPYWALVKEVASIDD